MTDAEMARRLRDRLAREITILVDAKEIKDAKRWSTMTALHWLEYVAEDDEEDDEDYPRRVGVRP